MANKEKIALLTKYQMKVLFLKCTQGLTHAEIAELLGRDVRTIQYHMTKIYTILEIKKPGKSKEEMDSELKREICPIIRKMFKTIDEINVWAPEIKDTFQYEKENHAEKMEEPVWEETQPPYEPPPSLKRFLPDTEIQPSTPEILEPPPPGRRGINWRVIIWAIIIGILLIIFWYIYLKPKPKLIETPTQPIPTRTALPPSPAEAPTMIPTGNPRPTPTFTPPIGMVYIPAGEFKMGSSRADDPEALDEEFPQHIVYLDAYWIDQTEVTNAQFALCVASGACKAPANNYSSTRDSYYDDPQYADYPVIFVSWTQAVDYCVWASRRLPSEAEWEKAARGPDGLIYPWGNNFDGTLTNYCDINCPNDWRGPFDDGYTDTSPVGNYPDGASVYGVLDMAGNVHEWVADWYAPYNQDHQTNPSGPDSGENKIIRGGSWGDDFSHVRTALRSPINPDNWMDFIGFRCAR